MRLIDIWSRKNKFDTFCKSIFQIKVSKIVSSGYSESIEKKRNEIIVLNAVAYDAHWNFNFSGFFFETIHLSWALFVLNYSIEIILGFGFVTRINDKAQQNNEIKLNRKICLVLLYNHVK